MQDPYIPLIQRLRNSYVGLLRQIGRIIPAILAAILPALFLYFYLVLVQKQFGLVGEGTWTAPLRTETAFFVYGVMLAGMVGSLFKHSVLLAAAPSTETSATRFLDLATYLFVGTVAAFLAAVLLPTALLVPQYGSAITSGREPVAMAMSREIDPFVAVNKWGLIVLAAAVGYASRETFGGLARTIRRAFEIAPGIANIEERVQAGLKAAIAPPRFVNFEGMLGLGLREVGKAWISSGPSAQIYEGGRYQIVVFIVGKARRNLPGLLAKTPIAITEGVDDENVTFDLAIDSVTAGARFLRQAVTVDTRAADECVSFDFMPQIKDPLEDRLPPGVVSDGRREAYVQVTLYQGAVYCADIRMKLSIISENGPS